MENQLTTLSIGLLAVPLPLAGTAGGVSAPAAAAAQHGSQHPARSFTRSGHLMGVAAVSAKAWAAGKTQTARGVKTLIVR